MPSASLNNSTKYDHLLKDLNVWVAFYDVEQKAYWTGYNKAGLPHYSGFPRICTPDKIEGMIKRHPYLITHDVHFFGVTPEPIVKRKLQITPVNFREEVKSDREPTDPNVSSNGPSDKAPSTGDHRD